MGIIERLKRFLGIKEKQLSLTSGNEIYNPTEDIKQVYRVQLPEKIKEPTIETCMEEFIKQYSLQEKINPNSLDKSYKAYRRMFCDQEEEIRT